MSFQPCKNVRSNVQEVESNEQEGIWNSVLGCDSGIDIEGKDVLATLLKLVNWAICDAD
jgi:hypothetical protein